MVKGTKWIANNINMEFKIVNPIGGNVVASYLNHVHLFFWKILKNEFKNIHHM